MSKNPLIWTVKKESYNLASLPMDLIVGDTSNRPPEFFITQIKSIAPEIMVEEDIGDSIKITIESERSLRKAFDKFYKGQ